MGRRAVPEWREEEPEAAISVLVADAQQVEHATLQRRLVDPDGPGAELPTVEYEVVGLCPHRHRVGLHPVEVLGLGVTERVVTGARPTGGLVHAHEQGEVHHPHVAVRTLVHGRAPEVVSQLAEHLAGGHPRVGNDEQQISRLRTEALLDCCLFRLAQELRHG